MFDRFRRKGITLPPGLQDLIDQVAEAGGKIVFTITFPPKEQPVDTAVSEAARDNRSLKGQLLALLPCSQTILYAGLPCTSDVVRSTLSRLSRNGIIEKTGDVWSVVRTPSGDGVSSSAMQTETTKETY